MRNDLGFHPSWPLYNAQLRIGFETQFCPDKDCGKCRFWMSFAKDVMLPFAPSSGLAWQIPELEDSELVVRADLFFDCRIGEVCWCNESCSFLLTADIMTLPRSLDVEVLHELVNLLISKGWSLSVPGLDAAWEDRWTSLQDAWRKEGSQEFQDGEVEED